MKNSSWVLVVLVTCLVFPNSSTGNPNGGVVVGGDPIATIVGQGTPLTVVNQSANRAVINWNSFSIANGETTSFVFNGGANSAVLNRVTGLSPSQISGFLQSTIGPGGPIGGTVMIINPAGILFTPTAQISVGSLVASTLSLDDDQFLNNNAPFTFSGASTEAVKN
jgi:filamentous hemagglutinin family protein